MEDYILIFTVLVCEVLFILRIKKIPHKIIKQVLVIAGSIILFFLSALVSEISNKESPLLIGLYALIFIPFFIFLFISLVVSGRYVKRLKSFVKNYRGTIATYKYQIIIFVLTFITRCWQIGTVQKWDSEEYYNAIMRACDSFDFTVATFFEQFMLISHPSHGYGFWTGIGAFLFPYGTVGILTMVLFLTCIANVKLYNLFCTYWIKMGDRQAFLGALLCLFLPLYWGTFSYLMPDYLIIIFLIFMLDAESKKNWITFFYWSLMACFSKEIGIVMVCSYFAVKSLCILASEKGVLKVRLVKWIKTPTIAAGILDGVLILAYMLINKGISSWKHSVYYSNPISWSTSSSSETLYNAFGIQSDNIITRLQQFFLVNFAWIFSLIILIGLCTCLIRRKTSLNAVRLIETSGILFGYGVFMCLYVTSGAIRYNLVFTVLFAAIAYVFLVDMIHTAIIYPIMVFLCNLLFFQSFYSIDGVTNRLFETVSVGNSKLLCIAQDSHRNPGGDYYVTNLQYISVNKNIEKMLKTIGFTDKDMILIAGEDYLEGSKNHSLTEINGRNSSIKWDINSGTYSNQYNSDLLNIRIMTTNELWGRGAMPQVDTVDVASSVKNATNRINGRLFVYFSPFYQSDNKELILEQLSQVFDIGEMKLVETWGNQLEFCELFTKGEEQINWANLNLPSETMDIEDRIRRQYYRNLQSLAIDFENQERNITEYGDTIAVTIAAYDNGKYVNLGYSPTGTVLRTLVLGNNQVFLEIEEALVNRKVGEEVSVVHTFPEQYVNNAEIAGKTLELRIIINAIQKELPELTQELMQEKFGVDSADEYYAYLKKEISK